MAEVIYTLINPIEYAWKGEKTEGSFITLTAPTFKMITKAAPIKQAFMSAITEFQKNVSVEADPSSSDGSNVTAKQIMQILYSSSINVNSLFLNAQELFKSGLAMLDGQQSLTVPLMEKMSVDDFEGLLGEYIANFILPSLINGA